MEKQKRYKKPEIEVVNFSTPDIITGSIGDSDVPDLPNGILGDEEEVDM